MTRDGPAQDYKPPEDIGANFFPERGCYSSNDPAVVEAHMREIRAVGIGVISVSWWGKDTSTDRAVPLILATAARHDVEVNFHIEPYPRRSARLVRSDIAYLIDRYGDAPAFYRDADHGNRPMFYVYDSYRVKEADWSSILSPTGSETIRGTKHDSIVLALWVTKDEGSFVLNGGFDGFYTYFATEGFTYGSTPSNWARLARWARAHEKIFVPGVGPGYADTRIRPWNRVNQRGREGGAYYDRMFRAAIDVRPTAISITSFNEWHEGTQIEAAVPKTIPDYTYIDYRPREPDYYLRRTRYWVERFEDALSADAVRK